MPRRSARAPGSGPRRPPPPGPAQCAAQGRGAATPASARPGNRVGTGWAEGKKGPTTLRGPFLAEHRPPEQGAQRPKWWAGLPIGPQGPTPGGHARAGREGVRGERACRAAARGPPSCAELAGDYAKRTRKNPEPFGPGSFPLVQLAPPRRSTIIIPHRLRFVKPACHCAGPPAAASAGPRAAHPPPRGRAGGGGSLPSVRCPLAAAIAGRPALACGPLPSQFTEK